MGQTDQKSLVPCQDPRSVKAAGGRPCFQSASAALQPVDLFGIDGAGSPAALHQPQALRQKREQHECGQYLRPAEAFACEESAHEETASVLPCRRTVRETSADERAKNDEPKKTSRPADADVATSQTRYGSSPRLTSSTLRAATALLPPSPFDDLGPEDISSDRMAFAPSGVLFSTFSLSGCSGSACALLFTTPGPTRACYGCRPAVELGLAIVALLPALLMSRIEHRPFGVLWSAAAPGFWQTVLVRRLWGFGSITILLLALHGANAFDFGGFALHGARALKFAVFWGRVLPDRRFLRRILHSRIYPVHV